MICDDQFDYSEAVSFCDKWITTWQKMEHRAWVMCASCLLLGSILGWSGDGLVRWFWVAFWIILAAFAWFDLVRSAARLKREQIQIRELWIRMHKDPAREEFYLSEIRSVLSRRTGRRSFA